MAWELDGAAWQIAPGAFEARGTLKAEFGDKSTTSHSNAMPHCQHLEGERFTVLYDWRRSRGGRVAT